MNKCADLGSIEFVNDSSKQEKHIDALEAIVDELREENRLIKSKLNQKPSTISAEQLEKLRSNYQAALAELLPF